MITVRRLSRALLCLAIALCVAAPVGLDPLAGRVSASTDKPLVPPADPPEQIAAPDLVIDDITWSPQNPALGQLVEFTVTYRNQGTDRTPIPSSFSVKYFVDGTPSPGGGGTDRSMASGAVATHTFYWTAEPGVHTFQAVIDYEGKIAESDETNNERTVTLPETLLPDLVIESITWEPLQPTVGDAVTFRITVLSSGVGEIWENFDLYISIDGKESRSVIEAQAHYNMLAAGGTRQVSHTWTAQAGSHVISAFVDKENSIPETDETNNAMEVTFSGTLLSDMVVDSITWDPATPSIGDDVIFTVTVTNNGTGQAAASFVYYFIDDQQVGRDSVTRIYPGATDTLTFTWKAEAGSHAIKAFVDYDEKLVESDETNNQLTVLFSGTSLADLVVDNISWLPLTSREGDTVTFSVGIKNQGTGKAADCDVHYFVDGDEIDSDSIGVVGPGDIVTESFTWTVGAGSRTIRVVADYREQVPESDETNNVKSVVFSSDTPSPAPTEANVYLYGQKTEVGVGDEVILNLSAVNLITKPDMTVQLILRVPSGMSVTSTEFVKGGAGQYTTSYSIAPGDIRQIEVHIMTNQPGNFTVSGDILYYFGDDQSTEERATVDLPVTVHDQSPAEAVPREEPGIGCMKGSASMTMTSMVELVAIGALTGLCWGSLKGYRGLRRRRRRK